MSRAVAHIARQRHRAFFASRRENHRKFHRAQVLGLIDEDVLVTKRLTRADTALAKRAPCLQPKTEQNGVVFVIQRRAHLVFVGATIDADATIVALVHLFFFSAVLARFAFCVCRFCARIELIHHALDACRAPRVCITKFIGRERARRKTRKRRCQATVVTERFRKERPGSAQSLRAMSYVRSIA